MKKLLLAALIGALVTACAHAPTARTLPVPAGCAAWPKLPMTVRLDESAALYYEQVNHAMKTWDRAVGRAVFAWQYVEDAPADVLVAADNLRDVGLRGFGPSFCVRGRVTATVFMDLNMDTIAATAVATHELGHALGLGHSTARTSIMYETVSDSLMGDWDEQRVQWVTDADARVVLAIHHPDPPRLRVGAVDDVDDEPAAVGTSPSKVTPVPDPERYPDRFLMMLFNAAKDGQWRLLSGLLLMAVVWAGRRWGGKAVPWLQTDRGGAVLVLLLALLGGIAVALVGNGPLGVSLIANSVAMAFLAAGGWSVLKKLLAPSDGAGK